MLKTGTIQVGNLEWFYRWAGPEGEKKTVLFLHGLPSQSYSWRHLMSRFEEQGLRTIAPDWIGCGYSIKPDRREFFYTPQAYLKALGDLVDTLSLSSFALVVQGFLGSLGVQYAFRNPDRVERLVIMNGPITPKAKLPWPMQQWGFPFVGDMLTQDPLLVDRTLEGGSGFQIADEDLDIYRRPFLKSSDVGRALVAIIQNLQLGETMTELASGWQNWSQPTQIIWGMRDPWLDGEEVTSLVKSRSNLELVSLEEAKHYPQEHWSKEIGPHLLKFLVCP